MSARSRRIASVLGRRLLVAAWHARLGLAPPRARRAAFALQLRLACEVLGPAFIKLGQLASVRPDVFSPELVFELEKLLEVLKNAYEQRLRRKFESDQQRLEEIVRISEQWSDPGAILERFREHMAERPSLLSVLRELRKLDDERK